MGCKFIGTFGNTCLTVKAVIHRSFSTASWETEAGTGTNKLKVVRVLPPFGTKLGRALANTKREMSFQYLNSSEKITWT